MDWHVLTGDKRSSSNFDVRGLILARAELPKDRAHRKMEKAMRKCAKMVALNQQMDSSTVALATRVAGMDRHQNTQGITGT